jgi:hypothetical protein
MYQSGQRCNNDCKNLKTLCSIDPEIKSTLKEHYDVGIGTTVVKGFKNYNTSVQRSSDQGGKEYFYNVKRHPYS